MCPAPEGAAQSRRDWEVPVVERYRYLCKVFEHASQLVPPAFYRRAAAAFAGCRRGETDRECVKEICGVCVSVSLRLQLSIALSPVHVWTVDHEERQIVSVWKRFMVAVF